MNKNLLIILAGGFLVVILLVVLMSSMMGGKEDPKPVAAIKKTEILVAARDIKLGKDLTEADLKWQVWPEEALFKGAIKRKDDQSVLDAASGKVLFTLGAGQPVHPDMLAGDGKGNFLAVTLREGMRAVAISVKARSMVGGFVGPGDYVDVILTHKVRVRNRDDAEVASMINRYASETILENVRVLAIDQTAKREEDKAKVARTITLEVAPNDAQKLALVSEMGDLTLSLRGIGDDTKSTKRTLTTDSKTSKVLKDLARIENGGSANMIRIYNGDAVENITVRQIEPIEDIEGEVAQ